MATTVKITFTGLCMFTQDGDSVVVRLPDAAESVRHCGKDLRPHVGMVLVEAHRLGAKGAYQKVGASVRGLDVTIGVAGVALQPPQPLTSIRELTGAPVEDPAHGRVLATIRLHGGRFTDEAVKASKRVSGPWSEGAKTNQELSWQATWEGQINESRLVLTAQAGTTVLEPDGGTIGLQIVNLMPMDIAEWLRPDNVSLPTPSQLPPEPAQDFRWFYRMYGLEGACDIPEPEDPATLRPGRGLPYTCLLGGE